MKKSYAAFLFIAILTVVSFYYGYNKIAFKKPQSVHKWRQSDCASIALNYYQGGMHFFSPETHNLTSDGGTSGQSMTSEIPVLYYSVACFYSVFGYHDYIYRIFNTLLFLLGLFYLFRLLRFLIKDVFWAITLALLFFTSPILVYYGNNYLSNSSALAFSIIGWYYFIRFYSEGKTKWFYISMAVFFLAAAFKVTALFSLFAVTGIYILEIAGLIKLKEATTLFKHPFRNIIPILAIFSIIGLWLIYAHNYNQKHDCFYFSTTIFPIWELDKAGINGVLDNIKNLWLDQYFHKSVLLFIAACFLFIMISFRKSNKLLFLSVIFILAEAITYIFLQFWTFADHDYYTIDMYILLILVVVTTFDILRRHYTRIFTSIPVKIAFIFILLFNVYYAGQKINERYTGWMNDYPANKDIYSITPYLRQIGITPTDTVISIPDFSHASLYLMNQKGWTEYTDTRFSKEKEIRYNQDSAGIQCSIDKGAKYLILNGIEELYRKPYLQSYSYNLKGRYNDVLIFDLRSNIRNFNIQDPTIDKIYRCSAEMLSNNHQHFIPEGDSSIKFQNGESRSSENARSGKYSCKLNESQPYGMTIRFKNLKVGESFTIKAWRKTGTKPSGEIVVSANSETPYYASGNKVLKKDDNGWEQIGLDVFISSGLADHELTIYVYNPNPEPVYFDDFEITRYKSILDN
jgi:hypothetical protein